MMSHSSTTVTYLSTVGAFFLFHVRLDSIPFESVYLVMCHNSWLLYSLFLQFLHLPRSLLLGPVTRGTSTNSFIANPPSSNTCSCIRGGHVYAVMQVPIAVVSAA